MTDQTPDNQELDQQKQPSDPSGAGDGTAHNATIKTEENN